MKETDFNKFLDDLKQTESYGVEQKKKKLLIRMYM